MFEDIEDDRIAEGAKDRVIVYAIWARDTSGRLSPARGWAILAERYPDEARFVLLAAYEELTARPEGWTVSRFLDDVQRALDRAGGRLHPEVRDLIAAAEDELHALPEEDAAKLDRIRRRVGMRTGDAGAAQKRLARLRTDFIRELHDRTQGGKRIGGAEREGSRPEAWKAAVSTASGPKKSYNAGERFATGELVEHPKFGVGVVTGVEPGRAQILFESGARKLVMA